MARAQCSKSEPDSRGALRLEVGVRLVGLELGSLDERDALLEDRGVVGDREVAVDRVRQPEAIVGDPGAHAAPCRWMPPVLDVPLGELARRGAQDVLARQLRSGRQERDGVLQLIPEPVRTAGLVEGRPWPTCGRPASGRAASR